MPSNFVIICGALSVIAALFTFNIAQTRRRVRRWADDKGYRIQRLKYRLMFQGPFTYARLQGGTVYRIVVEDELGSERRGFVRCHGWLSAMPGEATEVAWDKA